MIINSPNLRAMNLGFKANFMSGLGQAPNDHEFFCTPVSSTTLDEEYPWLGQLPGMREWVDERFLHNLKSEGYKLRNKDWEDTVVVPRNAILDDRYGVYSTPMRALGTAAASQPCELAYATLKAGISTVCYDGQFFFDTDHPVIAADGSTTQVSNFGGGAGALWVLMCTTKPIKPLIFQKRQEAQFTALDSPDNPEAFSRKRFIYGADSRNTAGYTMWQLAYASRQPLTPANYAAARQAMLSFKGDHGRPLGIKPDTLLVDSSNEQAGLKILNNLLVDGGNTNEWAGTAKLVMSAWMA